MKKKVRSLNTNFKKRILKSEMMISESMKNSPENLNIINEDNSLNRAKRNTVREPFLITTRKVTLKRRKRRMMKAS